LTSLESAAIQTQLEGFGKFLYRLIHTIHSENPPGFMASKCANDPSSMPRPQIGVYKVQTTPRFYPPYRDINAEFLIVLIDGYTIPTQTLYRK
jgi:hypothetical protein